jgi:hypothetical protein
MKIIVTLSTVVAYLIANESKIPNNQMLQASNDVQCLESKSLSTMEKLNSDLDFNSSNIESVSRNSTNIENKTQLDQTESSSKKIVKNFLLTIDSSAKVSKQNILHYNNKAVARVYTLEPQGYVITTIHKNNTPIKAYSYVL